MSMPSVSTVPVRKWYQIDFSPTAFCKRVFQSVYSEPATRSDSSAQQTDISGREDMTPEIKSYVSNSTMEESDITGPPSIHKPIADLRVQRGETAAFDAHITGFPAPQVSWFQDGKQLSASERLKLTDNSPHFSLTLFNTGSVDNGVYTCTARNAGGEVSCSAKLTVERGLGKRAEYIAGMNVKRRSLQSLYEIHEEIGRGSFGIVKCVTSRDSGESHAAKFLPLRKGTRRRAFEERDLLAQITHPRVACLLDSFSSRKTLVLLTELCSGHDLLNYLLSKATVKEREVGLYIQQVLEGIEHIHSLNILHLDLNPTNILMTLEKEEVKICDFGFSQKIDPLRYQYSKFGTPEFVAPEIVCQAPVTKATDIWSLGVLSYLCLTCRCPFSGESDRATLLSVREGKVSWDTPDVTSRSCAAQDFLRRVLQPEPDLRPTAAECLMHEWFQGLHPDQEFSDISTKNLTFFISRSKLQQSHICYGSAMVRQTMADLVAPPPQDASLIGAPTEQNPDSSSLSSGSSSEYDEIDDWATPLFISHEGREKKHLDTENVEPEPPERRIALVVPSKDRHTEEEVTWRQDNQRGALTLEWRTSQLTQGDSTSSLGMEDEGSSGGRVPRESLIKSTFYSSSEELSPLSARRMLLRQKKRTKRMERSRVRLRSAFSSRLGEPLLEHMEDSAEEDEGGSQRRGSSQYPVTLTKSCSFDSGPIACFNTQRQRRSRSLDEYSRKAQSTSELRESGEDDDGMDAFSSQEVLGQDKKYTDTVHSTFSESMAQSPDIVTEPQQVLELKEPTLEKGKDCSSEFATDELVEAEVPPPKSDDSSKTVVLECTASDDLFSEDITKLTASAFSPERVDGAVNIELWEDHQDTSRIQSETKDHSNLEPIFVESTTLISVVQDVTELLDSNYGLDLLERPRSMDISFKALETLDLEDRAHFPMIHKVRSHEVISKPSDLALLVPEPIERAHSVICSMTASAALEDACGFKSHSTKELGTVEIPAEISMKRADSFQEHFIYAPQEEELCANFPEAEVKRSCSEEDYDKVDSAEEVYPGLLEDIESGHVSSKSSVTNLSDREEACGGAGARPGIIVSSDEDLEEAMFESSSEKVSSYLSLETYRDNESDPVLKNRLEEIHTYEDHSQMTTEKSGWSDSGIPLEKGEFLARSGSLKVLNRSSIDIEEELQRYPSTPSLEIKTLPGKSGRIMGFFRQHSWTCQSSSPVERVVKRQASEGDSSDSLQRQHEQLKNPDQSITKRMKASVSSFSKAVLGRQTSKEDKKDIEAVQAMGLGLKSSPPFSHGKSPEAPGGSPKRSPGSLFSFKFPGFKRSKGPAFLQELADQAVSLGQEVTLWCRISGHPSPEIQWYKEARRLKTNDQIRLAVMDREYLSLTIYSAKEEDLGSYRCVASNATGQASTSCTLIVSELPTYPTGLQVFHLHGDGVLLVWKPVESITELSYCIEYSRDGREWRLLAEGLVDSYFTACSLAKRAQYEFRVACLNRAGRGSFSEPSVPISIRAEQQELLAPLIYTESTESLGLTGQAQFTLSTRHQTYSFLSEINRGRFSVVKQCREDQSGQLLAGKITPFKPQWRQWALKEYQLLRRLNHAHLVQLHVAFITPCYLVLIMELCQGQDLFHHLAARDLYGEMHVQTFLQQILSVANYMHRRRVAHLDLKSSNILVTEQSVLKVVDLGSAHVFTPGQPILTERLLEIADSKVTTDIPKAPEVLEGQGVGPETDIWAIGVLAFIMLSADEPFERERNMKKSKVQFGRCYSGMSEGALNFMKKALNTKPQSRPSATECLQMPWIQGARPPSKHRDAVVCFTTDKLRSYLQEREPQRQHSHTELDAYLFQ